MDRDNLIKEVMLYRGSNEKKDKTYICTDLDTVGRTLVLSLRFSPGLGLWLLLGCRHWPMWSLKEECVLFC